MESIIATIEGEELSELEDFPIVKSISHKSALEHVNSLLLYITQDCDSELQVDTAFLSNLKKLRERLRLNRICYSKRVFLHFIINKVYI